MRSSNRIRMAAVAGLMVALILALPGFAQQRMSDKDIESMMNNLKNDSKRFESSFNQAISKSTIRKTTQEKTDKNIVKTFQDQTETMLSVFKDKRTANTTLPGVIESAKQIDAIFMDVHMDGVVKTDWKKCRTELATLADQFNMPMN
jgi:glycyl-tRNA synthetase (class II)